MSPPSEIRQMLRERLGRFLPVHSTPNGPPQRRVRPLLSDIEVVELILDLEFIEGSDVGGARALYEQASQDQMSQETVRDFQSNCSSLPKRPDDEGDVLAASTELSAPDVIETVVPTTAEETADGQQANQGVSVRVIAASPVFDGLSPPPSFDELVRQGWIRVSWGRFSVPRDIRMAIMRSPANVAPAFKALMEIEFKDGFRLTDRYTLSGARRDVALSIVEGRSRPDEIDCVSPAWIAARLWDTDCESGGSGGGAERIGHWVDRWAILRCPAFAPSMLLEPVAMDVFVDAAFEVLTAVESTPGWEDFRRAARAPISLLYPHRASEDTSIVPELPGTTIDRIEWMSRGEPQVAFYDFLESRASTLLSALLNEVQEATFDTRRLVPRLIEVAVERPVYLELLVLRARNAPVLMADMLMEPATCPLACSLVASWEARGNGSNRDFRGGADQTTTLLAYEDAIALLGGHLDTGRVPVNELAALYLKVYELASDPRGSHRHYSQLTILREEISGASADIHDCVVAALLARVATEQSPMNAFCASLDLASEGGCVDRIDGTSMISTYLDLVMKRGERVGVRQMEVGDAAALVTLALKKEETRKPFLGAVNIPDWLQVGPSSPDEGHTFNDLLARRVRLHIRVLSRSIAGWPSDIPKPVVDALIQAIQDGAAEQARQGRVDAFVLELGVGLSWAPQERPIALDLSAALRRLEGAALQRLVTALCQVREPVVLAGIVANTPPAISDQIKDHLLTLTPQNSSAVFMLPALRARVEALLNAELPDLAEVFIAAEREAVQGRVIPNGALSDMRASLLALVVREDWAAIASFVVPDSIRVVERREADEVLLFYKAVAELRRPGGDPAAAEASFLELSRRHQGVTGYHTNLFASRVQRLLGSNVLGLLSGDDLSQAKRYLAEAQREVRPLIQHSAFDLKALDGNRAMLLLAAGQPQEALQVLLEVRESDFDAKTEAFRALAVARIGSKREALAVLTQAERVFGRTEILSAIRENIDTHRPFSTAPSLSLDDDPVPGLRQAFEAFARLGHVEQAEVLEPRGQFDRYVLEQVRGACASVVALAPMMSALGMVRREDDISGVLKQILLSRLLLVQWAVEDQSLGGFSKTGGVGERDIVVKKGAATLAVLEALIVDSVERCNLTTHFNKLLGYDTCRLFFHITYARGASCSGIMRHLKSMCATPPAGISYVRFNDLEDFDSMPIGFIARYHVDSREVAVVFLVLDLGQAVQRAAAAAQ